jgi:hypothetical protein
MLLIQESRGLGLFFQEYGGQYTDACNVRILAGRETPFLDIYQYRSLFNGKVHRMFSRLNQNIRSAVAPVQPSTPSSTSRSLTIPCPIRC